MFVKKDLHSPTMTRSSAWAQNVCASEDRELPDSVAALSDDEKWPKLSVTTKNDQVAKIPISPSSSTSTQTKISGEKTTQTETGDSSIVPPPRRGPKQQWKKVDIDITYNRTNERKNAPGQRSTGPNGLTDDDLSQTANGHPNSNKRRPVRRRFKTSAPEHEDANRNGTREHDVATTKECSEKDETDKPNGDENSTEPNSYVCGDNRNHENNRNGRHFASNRHFNEHSRRQPRNNQRNARYSVPSLFQAPHSMPFFVGNEFGEGFAPTLMPPGGAPIMFPHFAPFFVPTYPDLNYLQLVNDFGQQNFFGYRGPMMPQVMVSSEAQSMASNQVPGPSEDVANQTPTSTTSADQVSDGKEDESTQNS